MSRFGDRLPADVPIDHPYTRGLLLAFAGLVGVALVWVVPKIQTSRAHRSEQERGHAMLDRLRAERPAGTSADSWDQRCTWVWNACGAGFFHPFDRSELAQFRRLNDAVARVLAEPVTDETPNKLWALAGESCERGRHYAAKYRPHFLAVAVDREGLGAMCGGVGQVVLTYGHFAPD